MKPLQQPFTGLLIAVVSFGMGFGSSFQVGAVSSFLQTAEEKTIVEVVEMVDPAVVSVVISKDLPVMEQSFEEIEIFDGITILAPKSREIGKQKQRIGGGTAFFISEDGLMVTNHHVVSDPDADYTVVANDGKTYTVDVLTRNPELDLALLKVRERGQFPIIRLSSSNTVERGQTVIAIGNALGEFRNTISKGIVSGLERSVLAENNRSFTEIIQTDAAINSGNSGGPLLNTKGELIGVNFSAVMGAENISFAVPVSHVKQLLQSYDVSLIKKNNPEARQQRLQQVRAEREARRQQLNR
ncbi:MAG: S1C family serine protease [Candidatus Altimarinota bacterium]